jgi:hypothetical protein
MLLITPDQKGNNGIHFGQNFWKRNQGCQWSPVFCCMMPLMWDWRHQWPKKVQRGGKGAEVALLQLGGTLHFEKPPLPRRSTAVFWDCPSGDLLKASEYRQTRKKTAVKAYHAKETFQLFDILGERARIN